MNHSIICYTPEERGKVEARLRHLGYDVLPSIINTYPLVVVTDTEQKRGFVSTYLVVDTSVVTVEQWLAQFQRLHYDLHVHCGGVAERKLVTERLLEMGYHKGWVPSFEDRAVAGVTAHARGHLSLGAGALTAETRAITDDEFFAQYGKPNQPKTMKIPEIFAIDTHNSEQISVLIQQACFQQDIVWAQLPKAPAYTIERYLYVRKSLKILSYSSGKPEDEPTWDTHTQLGEILRLIELIGKPELVPPTINDHQASYTKGGSVVSFGCALRGRDQRAKMKTARLKRLSGLLRAPLPPNTRFDMSTWHSVTPCGTVACAAGLAAVDPWFMARGLRLSAGGVGVACVGLRQSSIEALCNFFGLEWEVAERIFFKSCYSKPHAVTKAMVANRIDKIIYEQTTKKAS